MRLCDTEQTEEMRPQAERGELFSLTRGVPGNEYILIGTTATQLTQKTIHEQLRTDASNAKTRRNPYKAEHLRVRLCRDEPGRQTSLYM